MFRPHSRAVSQAHAVADFDAAGFDLVGHQLTAVQLVGADGDQVDPALSELGGQAFQFEQVLGANGAMQAAVENDQHVKVRGGGGTQHKALSVGQGHVQGRNGVAGHEGLSSHGAVFQNEREPVSAGAARIGNPGTRHHQSPYQGLIDQLCSTMSYEKFFCVCRSFKMIPIARLDRLSALLSGLAPRVEVVRPQPLQPVLSWDAVAQPMLHLHLIMGGLFELGAQGRGSDGAGPCHRAVSRGHAPHLVGLVCAGV